MADKHADAPDATRTAKTENPGKLARDRGRTRPRQAEAPRPERHHPGTGAEIETLVLDLADLASVQQAAQTVQATARPLDVLVNNAAVMPGRQRQATRDGFELAFGTNHLGHYALTGHLLPALLAAPEARVITVCAGRGSTCGSWRRRSLAVGTPVHARGLHHLPAAGSGRRTHAPR